MVHLALTVVPINLRNVSESVLQGAAHCPIISDRYMRDNHHMNQKGRFRALSALKRPFHVSSMVMPSMGQAQFTSFGLNRYFASSESGLMKMVVSLSMILP